MVDFTNARKTMVENQLITSAVIDRQLLSAMRRIPRERFVPAAIRELAYIDSDLTLKPGRQLSAPAPFAKLVQLADIRPDERVLDLGCGTGYSASVLAAISGSVVAVDPDAELADAARANLAAEGVANVEVVTGPIDTAAKGHGVFDVVVVEGVVGEIPQPLWSQLKERGRLVALVAESGQPPVAHVYVRTGAAIAGRAEFNAMMPPVEPASRADEFVF
jgi:protein-L-isoaspartate(D-aspartate) O-methyltransferase